MLLPSLARSETVVRLEMTGPVRYSDVQYITDALSRLNPIKAVRPVSQMRNSVVLEGLFPELQTPIWETVKQLASERFDVGGFNQGNVSVVTLRKLQ